jgi:hypothetical protein
MDWMAQGREPSELCRSQGGSVLFAVVGTDVFVGVSGEGRVLQTVGIRQ